MVADGRHFTQMQESWQFPAPTLAPPRLWDEATMEAIEWRKVYRVPEYAPRRRKVLSSLIQLTIPRAPAAVADRQDAHGAVAPPLRSSIRVCDGNLSPLGERLTLSNATVC